MADFDLELDASGQLPTTDTARKEELVWPCSQQVLHIIATDPSSVKISRHSPNRPEMS